LSLSPRLRARSAYVWASCSFPETRGHHQRLQWTGCPVRLTRRCDEIYPELEHHSKHLKLACHSPHPSCGSPGFFKFSSLRARSTALVHKAEQSHVNVRPRSAYDLRRQRRMNFTPPADLAMVRIEISVSVSLSLFALLLRSVVPHRMTLESRPSRCCEASAVIKRGHTAQNVLSSTHIFLCQVDIIGAYPADVKRSLLIGHLILRLRSQRLNQAAPSSPTNCVLPSGPG
jgi:hypothetical protein